VGKRSLGICKYVESNEMAGHMARKAVMTGRLMQKPSIATLAGIKHAYRIHEKRLQIMRTVRGLTWTIADRDPMGMAAQDQKGCCECTIQPTC